MALLDPKDKDVYVNWAQGTVRYSDLDPNGHVNNGAINAFFEDGRVRFREDQMIQFGDDILRGFALVKFSVEYLSPLFFPSLVDIGTRVTRVGNSSYDLGQAIFCKNTCSAVAEVVTVFIDKKNNSSKALPSELKTILNFAMKK